MSGSAPIIVITEKQSAILNEFAASRSVSVSLSQRSRIVLMAFKRVHNDEIAKEVGINRNQVGKWRHRWKAAFYDLVAVECSEGIPALKEAIVKLLSDAHRSGRPPSTTSKQLTQVAALACEPPSDSGRPISRWTSMELGMELVRRMIFTCVSASSIRRWLNRMDLKPHRHKYWLFGPDRSSPDYDACVRLICDVYAEATEAYEHYGIHTICIDEQTGIQALERIALDKPCDIGTVRRLEYESCVRYVAEQCGIDPASLGEKGRSGILKDQTSRREFLSNPLRRIHFYFTPKHSSWLNQIEIWFGVVRSKLTRYGSFNSLGNLRNKLTQFIDYYNDVLAHPYEWTYRGKPMCA